MDITDYLSVLKKNLVMIILVVVLFVAITLIVTWQKPVSYQSSSAIEVTRYQVLQQSDVAYFQYDNFYNTQVATTFANNLVGLSSAPSIVSQTYKDAGYEIPPVSIRDLGKTFTAKKKADGSSVVDLSFTSNDYTMAKKMMVTLTNILKEKLENNNAIDSSARFSINIVEPVIVANPRMYALNAVIAGLFGLFVSVSFAFIKESAKK